MRRSTVLVLVLALCAAALGAFMVVRPTIEYAIPVAELQSRIDARMPIEGKRFGVSYVVDGVGLTLVDEGRATVSATVGVEGFGRGLAFEATGTAVPKYAEGAFRLTDVTIDHAKILSLVEKHGAIAATGRFVGILEKAGIVSDERIEGIRTKVSEAVEEALVERIENRPVYVLDTGTVKGNLAAMALRDMKVDASGVTVFLDPFGLVARILLWGLLAVLVAGSAVALLRALAKDRRGFGSAAAGMGADLFGDVF